LFKHFTIETLEMLDFLRLKFIAINIDNLQVLCVQPYSILHN